MAAIPAASRGLKQILAKSPEDIVILSSLRTAITRSYKGGFKDAYPEELLHHVLKATLAANPTLDPSLIGDVAVGTVLSELGGSKAGRMTMNASNFSTSTSFYTVNRACASGLQAITAAAASIETGMVDIAIGGGMESMTRNYGSRAIPQDVWPDLKAGNVGPENGRKDSMDCIMAMGLTSENVALRYGVSRADQDALAVESHRRAAAAQDLGKFKDQIVPVTTRFQPVDKAGEKTGPEEQIAVVKDDGVRAGLTLGKVAKLKPAFQTDGTSTAGNSSQISDGAAATLMMRRSTAAALGLEKNILGKWAGTSVVGCKPDEMGIGPALAIPKLLAQTGLSTSDIGVWEINEAFASQALYCIRDLGLEEELAKGRINPNGGAIALGHPLGATGARMVSDLLPELQRQDQRLGVVSMCIGTGMGSAALFVRE